MLTTPHLSFKSIGLLLCLILCCLPAYAARKALVIGNANYEVKRLPNPLNDSSEIAKKLRSLHFQVTHEDDLNYTDMRNLIRNFAKTLNTDDEAFFYFSGHGAQYDNINYLIPVGHDIKMEDEIEGGAIRLGFILNKLGNSKSRLNIVVLDACRDNPFLSRFKSGKRGLAKLSQQMIGTLVAFATEAGGVSDDGDQGNGVYTKALLKYMGVEGIMLSQMFTRVRREVYHNTNKKQAPSEVNGLLEDVYLAGYKKDPPSDYYTNSIGMKFKTIPAGSFYMGSCNKWTPCPSGAAEDNNADEDETPQYLVQISKDFQMGVYEVTVGQFNQFINSAHKKDLLANDFRKNNDGDNVAVSDVSWEETQLFIDWLNKKEGGSHYRLPTEAEWEYAARAGTTTAYSWGESANQAGQYAWYNGNANDAGEKYAHSVGKKKSNPWGLYDMHGNVWEWVNDAYEKQNYWNYFKQMTYSVTPNSHPNEVSGQLRVNRGGGWYSLANSLRSTERFGYSSDFHDDALGFRLVRQP